MIYDMLKNDWSAGRLANSYILIGEDLENLLKETNSFISDNLFPNTSYSLESNPDYLMLKSEIVSNKEQKFINVAQAREAIEFFSKTSWVGQARILLVYKAEKMNENCSNALLKLLEDTPRNSYIFLLTDNANNIIQTIRSRSREVNSHDLIKKNYEFSYLNIIVDYIEKDVEKFLKEIESENGKKIWEYFTRELCTALHQIVLASTSNVSLTDQQSNLAQLIIKKDAQNLLELYDKVNYYTSNSIKYDLSKRHIFYLIAEILRSEDYSLPGNK